MDLNHRKISSQNIIPVLRNLGEKAMPKNVKYYVLLLTSRLSITLPLCVVFYFSVVAVPCLLLEIFDLCWVVR